MAETFPPQGWASRDTLQFERNAPSFHSMMTRQRQQVNPEYEKAWRYAITFIEDILRARGSERFVRAELTDLRISPEVIAIETEPDLGESYKDAIVLGPYQHGEAMDAWRAQASRILEHSEPWTSEGPEVRWDDRRYYVNPDQLAGLGGYTSLLHQRSNRPGAP